MKKILAIAVAALSFGAMANDSYLYWMVGNDLTWKEGTAPDYSQMAVGVLDASGQNVGYLNCFGYGGSGAGGNLVDKGSGAWYANLGSYASGSYSFYIELFNDNMDFVGRSQDILSYNSALAYTTTFGTSQPLATPWAPSSFTTAAVPEPNSALLILLGCAGLALKRKKQGRA